MLIIWIILLAICVIAVSLTVLGRGDKEKGKGVTLWVPDADDPVETGVIDSHSDSIWDAYIAGLGHHCTVRNVGVFGGPVFNEKDNPADKKAMAFGNAKTKRIIGYIPSAVLDDYRKWCGRKTAHCVGYIFKEGDTLRGRARIYHPDCDLKKVGEDSVAYILAVCERFGWEAPTGDFDM